MANFVVEEVIKKLLDNSLSVKNSECLILGFSFKENCRDIRNTKVNDIVKLLESKNVKVSVYDPWIDRKKARDLYNINFLETFPTSGTYSAVVIAVAHEDFKQLEISQVRGLLKKNGVIYDIKSIFPQAEVDGTL